jgi:hypothetical protein
MQNTLYTLQNIVLVYIATFIYDIFGNNDEFVRGLMFITTICFVITIIKFCVEVKKIKEDKKHVEFNRRIKKGIR